MFTVTVLAAPARADLTEAVLDPLRRDWQGGRRLWLAPDLAAEFPVAARPADFDTRAEALRGQGFDIAIQPTVGRRKALLLADMDSTMIGQECIDELAAVAGVGPRVAAITARAMNGELNFHEALIERVGLLAGLEEAVIAKVLAERITLDYRRAGLDERTRTILDYAAKITSHPVECEESDIQRLRDLGFSDQAIFDIAETAAMYNFTNRLASATGMLPNPEYHSLGQ